MKERKTMWGIKRKVKKGREGERVRERKERRRKGDKKSREEEKRRPFCSTEGTMK
jgi:hypothetical protein